MLEANQPQESLMISEQDPGSASGPPRLARQPTMRNRGAKGLLDRVIVPEEDDRDTIFQAAHGEGHSIFFSHLRILPDGGLSKTSMAGVLYNKTRVLMVLASLGFVAFNLYTVISTFRGILHSRKAANVTFVLLIDHNDSNAGQTFWILQFAISVFEVLAMAWMLFYTAYVGLKLNSASHEKMEHYRIWHQVYEASAIYVQTMTNFSAMKTLQFLNPQVLGSELALALTQVEEGAGYARVLLCFAVTRLLMGAMGFVAFVIKFSQLVVQLLLMISTPQGDSGESGEFGLMDDFKQIALLFGFINQVFGITQVWQVEQKRLFLFIFGGEDAAMQAGEVDRQEAFLACVAQFICTELYKDAPSPFARRWRRAVALLGFTHLDVQSFVLLEDESLEVDADTIRRRSLHAADVGAPEEELDGFVSFVSVA